LAREIVTVIETDSLLVKCPHCGAWPMAAGLPKASSAHRVVRFRCPECQYQETGRLRGTSNVHALSPNRAQGQQR
jgi:transposase-like protein